MTPSSPPTRPTSDGYRISRSTSAAVICAASALPLWLALGGHLYLPETLDLVFGHVLYGVLIGAIALFSASISESAATAAIIALAFTIGSWVLDFALAGQPGPLGWISQLSLTQTLRAVT